MSTAGRHTHVNVAVALRRVYEIGLGSLVEGAACLWFARHEERNHGTCETGGRSGSDGADSALGARQGKLLTAAILKISAEFVQSGLP